MRRFTKTCTVVLGAALVLAACGGAGKGEPSGLDSRTPVSSLKIPTGWAGGVQVRATDAFPGLKVDVPTVVTNADDGSNRVLVAERKGVVKALANERAAVLLDITDRVESSTGEGGLLGLAFDPAFQSNGFFYVYYVVNRGSRKLRLSRFVAGSSGAANAASERVVLEFDHPAEAHFGGWIGFGNDGMLYISSGDGLARNAAQDTQSLMGKILRIQVNADGTHAIPADNPFGNAVWAYGLRNPWRCSIDKPTGDLWCGDVGELTREEVNRIERAGNYGWPLYEGSSEFDNPKMLPYASFEPAVHEYDRSEGSVVVGGHVYRGQASPALTGRYVFGDAGTSNLWALELDAQGQFLRKTLIANDLDTTLTLGENEQGELLGGTAEGSVFRVEAVSAVQDETPMPATLSGTGFFADMAQLVPATGVIDYEVNAPFWSDGAAKRRWLAVPSSETVVFDADDAWIFPLGTVVVKHFDLPRADGGSIKVETRVLVNRASGWTGYTYRWRDDQIDADLLLNGTSAQYDTVDPSTRAPVRLTWTFPSQTQCMNCHSAASGRILGVGTWQMNRGHRFATSGKAANQLDTFNHIGLFATDIGTSLQYGALPDPQDQTVSVDERARSYLHANCSQCHRPGGPTSLNMDLQFTTAQDEMHLLGIAAVQPSAASGLRIAPGQHGNSEIWKRVSALGSERMPPISSGVVDLDATKLLADWIDASR